MQITENEVEARIAVRDILGGLVIISSTSGVNGCASPGRGGPVTGSLEIKKTIDQITIPGVRWGACSPIVSMALRFGQYLSAT